MKIRAKLLVFLIPLLLGSGFLVNYLTKKAVRASLYDEVSRAAAANSKRILETSAQDFKTADEGKLLPVLLSVALDLKALYAFAIDDRGVVLAHTNVAEKGATLSAASVKEIFSDPAPAYKVTRRNGLEVMEAFIPVLGVRAESSEEFLLAGAGKGPQKRLGMLVAGLPLEDALKTERDIVEKNMAILLGVYSTIIAAVVFLTGLTLKPIQRLIEGANRVRFGDYDISVPVTTNDEFGELARSFNKMSETLSGTVISKNYLDAIVDNMLDPLIVADPDGVIRKTNKAARDALRLGEAELAGRGITELFSGDRPEHRQWLGLLKKNGEVRDYESVLLAGSGADIPVRVSAAFIKDTAGVVTGIVVTARDITLRKKYEAELTRSNEELQRFAYVASHDLQEPLRTVSNYVQLLENKYKTALGPEADKYVYFITDATLRMRAMVRDLLEYSRINADLRPEKVDTTAALDYVAGILQDAIAGAGAVIRRGYLPVIEADRVHIERLFQNLISNAIKFRREEPPLIRVSAEAVGSEWVFSVGDNGIGINREYGCKLFKIFGRLHGKDVQGAGIGLAACKKIVECYGGRIWFDSVPGKGSTFFFSIGMRPPLPGDGLRGRAGF